MHMYVPYWSQFPWYKIFIDLQYRGLNFIKRDNPATKEPTENFTPSEIMTHAGIIIMIHL